MTQDAHDANPSSPQLLWAEDGSPRSGRFGDVYFSQDDGLAETRAVFLAGCNMPDVWQGRRDFTVGELGFGTGLNIIALIEMWRHHRPEGARLHVFTVEGYPLSRNEAARALSAWPDVAETANALLDQWPSTRPGMHRIDLDDWGVTIDLAIGEVEWALAQWQGSADAWFLDGFSPALNPGMWSEDIMAAVAAHSSAGCHLATFTVAGAVRRALSANGFTVAKMPGHGRKRERLEARKDGLPPTSPIPTLAVIGAGIAGASIVRAAKAQGLSPILIEASHPGAEASGFPAALVTPRLDAGDAFISGFYAQALERAGQVYGRIPDAIIASGVIQLEQAPRDANRFDKIAAQPLWPDHAMQRLSAEQASQNLGEAVAHGGLNMATAFALSPATVIAHWLQDTPVVQAHVHRLIFKDGTWAVMTADGHCLARVDHVVVTAGWGSAALLPQVQLAAVAGQAEWTTNDPALSEIPVAWGGYSVPTHDGMLYGATHDRGVTAPVPSAEASSRNRDTLSQVLPERAARHEGAQHHSRTAVRATTPDRLPYCGEIAEGLHLLSGLGSRGFCAAPLLAEHLVSTLTGTPSPLPATWSERLLPSRKLQSRS